MKSQQSFKSDHHKVYTEEINKISLSGNDDKRLQTFNKVTTYPYGINVFKLCESEMLALQISELIRNLKNAKQATMSFVAEVIPLSLLNDTSFTVQQIFMTR